MKHIVKQAGLTLVSMVAVLSLVVVPVGFAHGSEKHDDARAPGTTPGIVPEDEAGNRHVKMDSAEPEAQTVAADDVNRGDYSSKLHDKARQLLQDRRKNGKERPKVDRQKACDQRQGAIGKRTTRFGIAAQRHLDAFDKTFAKVLTFYDDRQLDVADYDTLVSAVTTKRIAAQTSVDALKALDIPIDCTQDDPAGSIASVKATVSDTRAALQAYRTTLKDLIVAVKAVAPHDAASKGDR